MEEEVYYCMGIDEAGRGPVLGPMVYGCAYCPLAIKNQIKERGYDDSKVLTEMQRESLFASIHNSADVGWSVIVLSPEELSQKMQRRSKYNLNEISHDTAADLIRATLNKGIKLKEIYVDTVGTPQKYQWKLSAQFPGIDITVSKKADSLFPIVSAASICAKVIRDKYLEAWKFKETGVAFSRNFGSGYPADPFTVKWLDNHLEPVFGYPSLIRFSWRTCSKLLEDRAIKVTWEGDEEEEENSEQADPTQTKLVARTKSMPRPRFRYFTERNMSLVDATDF
ncbi:Ribonuclease H2 subunit A [Balamuthia mandrillaris]